MNRITASKKVTYGYGAFLVAALVLLAAVTFMPKPSDITIAHASSQPTTQDTFATN